MLTKETVLNEIGIDKKYLPLITAGWNITVSEMPEIPFFLTEKHLNYACKMCSIDQTVQDEIQTLARFILASPAMKTFAWHVYSKLALHPIVPDDPSNGNFVGWPLPKCPDNLARHFYRILFLAIIPQAVENYAKQGVSNEIIKATLFAGNSSQLFDPIVLAWSRNYQQAQLFQLGRFQYRIIPNNLRGVVLQRKNCKERIIVCGSGYRLTKDGVIAVPGHEQASDVFSPFVETPSSVCGFPVNKQGRFILEKQSFFKSEWDVILRPGELLIDMHIPAGGGMTPERCKESFKLAFDFFDKLTHASVRNIICCYSWIFNSDLIPLLPESNLTKLMLKCHLYPWPSTGEDGMFFLFGSQKHDSWDQYPHDTSQRRAMLHILESGRLLRTGGMFFFQDELD